MYNIDKDVGAIIINLPHIFKKKQTEEKNIKYIITN